MTPSSSHSLRAVLGPRPRDVHHVDEPHRQLLAELRERLEIAGLGELDDLRLDRPPDPGQARRAAVDRELRNRDGRFSDPRRRPPIRGQSERVGAVELEQVGQELELIRQIGVARKRLAMPR